MGDTTRESLLAWLDLLRTSNAIKKDVDARFRLEFGQSISRFDALAALERANRNGLRAGALSRQLVVSEGNVTQMMGKLLRDGLVLKRNDDSDARVVIYSLSDEGKTLFGRMARAHRRWIQNVFAEFSGEELAQFRDLLKKLPRQLRRKEVA
ncbi:MAG: MarR family transcriptional regulator [Pseudomonadota bacterium]